METSRARERQKSSFRQRPGHTPLCLDTCNLEHHDLIVALCLDGRHVRGRIHYVGVLPTALMEAIEYLKLQGWHIDSEIPDPLEELRCPLLYLACAFGKIGIVEGLLRHNFNPRVVNRHGETSLHGAVKHLYNAVPYTRQRKSVEPGTNVNIHQRREEAFFSILSLLTEFYPRILCSKDNRGFTALHLSATMVTRRNCNEHYRRCTKLNKRASFQKFCLKLMIKRLFELEAVSLLTKNEVMEIITTSDNGDGESLLHVLARDSKGGFEVLKFIHGLLLSLGTELPNSKSRRNETVFFIAWRTDARGTAEIFPGISQQQPCQDTSTITHSEILQETGDQVLNINSGTPQEYYNFENATVATGHPFAELSSTWSTSFQPEADHVEPRVLTCTPKITHTFSLASDAAFADRPHPSSPKPSKSEDVETSSTASTDFEIVEIWATDKHSDWDQQHTDADDHAKRNTDMLTQSAYSADIPSQSVSSTDIPSQSASSTDIPSQSASSENVETSSTSSSDVEIVEPWELDDSSDRNQLPWLQSDVASNIESDSSFLEFVLTEGVSLDALAKRGIVSVVLTQHKEKLRELEDSMPQVEQMLIQSETSIVQKTARLNSLQKEVDSLKKEIAERNKSRNELRQRIELMNEERNILKRRVAHCEETQNLLQSPSKKGRL
ncbi:hypothetical protein ACROYT_G010462 [Oculina patagonica]